MLAGLTCQIGVVPFLQFIDTQADEQFNPVEIKEALPFVATRVSVMVLDKWNFPDELKNIPQQLDNWFLMEQTEQAQLADIVLLARYHSLLDGKSAKQLPPITSLPSFSHLKNGGLTADKSLQILQDARKKVQDVMQLFPK
jgi:HD-like signal output (HDOD) protein